MLARLGRIGNAVGADMSHQGRYMTCARPVRAFGVASRAARNPMTGTARSSEVLDLRRRKLLFRSWHRGMREMDLIMGRFADATVQQLTQDELAEFEHLMEVPDRELLAWITGEADVPPDYDTALFRRLREFNRRGEGAR
jgi:antitoxin CptB